MSLFEEDFEEIYENIDHRSIQISPSYFKSPLGGLNDADVFELLDNRKKTEIDDSIANVYSQRFESIRYPAAGVYFNHPGRFEFSLELVDNAWKLYISVYWRFQFHDMSGNPVAGNLTKEAAIITRANEALQNYWGNPTDPLFHFYLVSTDCETQIPIIPRVLKYDPNIEHHYTIHVFPDGFTNTVQEGELPRRGLTVNDNEYYDVYINGVKKDFGRWWWAMSETRAFQAWNSPGATAGDDLANGPHEFGHMMGLGHNIGDANAVMGDAGVANTRFKYRDHQFPNYNIRAIPYTADFKFAKVWADKVFYEFINPNKGIYFIIISPFDPALLRLCF